MQFSDDSKLSCWCIFDYSCIKQADFDSGLNELKVLSKPFSSFSRCRVLGNESHPRNSDNDFKFRQKKRLKQAAGQA